MMGLQNIWPRSPSSHSTVSSVQPCVRCGGFMDVLPEIFPSDQCHLWPGQESAG